MLSHVDFRRLLVLVVAPLWVLAGCQVASAPLIADDIYQAVVSADRERNYDLAWQDIARLNGAIERHEYAVVVDESLVVAARMARLHRGQPDRLADNQTAKQLHTQRQHAQQQSREDNVLALSAAGAALRQDFEQGLFDQALDHAIEIYALSQWVVGTGQ